MLDDCVLIEIRYKDAKASYKACVSNIVCICFVVFSLY